MLLNKYSKITPFLIVTVIALLGLPSWANAYCGDGLLEKQFEECDDANFTNRDGCSSYCKVEDMTAPALVDSNPANNATGVATDIPALELTFSEPLNPASITPDTIHLKHGGEILKIEVVLNKDQTTVSITPKQMLFSEKRHSIYIKGVRDVAGNIASEPIILLFNTAQTIDRQPPFVVVTPPGGEYNVAQSLSLPAYLDDRIFPDNLDPTAKVYFTLDGSKPTKSSSVFSVSKEITIRTDTTLHYFSEDGKGNRTPVQTVRYTFKCGDRPFAKTVVPYPFCTIQECNYGYTLEGNTCQARLDGVSDDPFAGALLAPLFPSATPMNISSKPAIRLTEEHQGRLKRPIVFYDSKRGTTVNFARDTLITRDDGKPFIGYIAPPDNLYSKDFPIHFGYTFKSIFSFFPATRERIHFQPAFTIDLPVTDIFDDKVPIYVFSYDPESERYRPLAVNRFHVDEKQKSIRITSNQSDLFFVAQAAAGYNQVYFTDMVDHWAQNYAELLFRKEIVKGKAKGIFSPNDPLTRAEFLKICLRAIDATIPTEDELSDSPFKDVPLSAWQAPYVQKALELKLVNGYANGKFLPDRPINRAEAIKILVSAFQFDLKESENVPAVRGRYADLFKKNWYTPYVDFVVAHDLLSAAREGKSMIPGKKFGPDRPMTRGDMAQLTVKALELREAMKKRKQEK